MFISPALRRTLLNKFILLSVDFSEVILCKKLLLVCDLIRDKKYHERLGENDALVVCYPRVQDELIIIELFGEKRASPLAY